MQETDSFKTIFQFETEESRQSVTINETGGRAKIRHLNIISSGVDLFLLKESFSNQLSSHFRKGSHCTRNADGVLLFERPEGKAMVLCELKSSGGGVFDSAYQQAFSTYMKTCMTMSLCEDFDISNFTVYFIFTAQKSPELAVRQNELEQIDEAQRDFYGNVRLELLQGKQVRFRMNQIPHNFSFLHHHLTDKEVVCMLLTSPTDSIDFNISTLT